MSFLHQSWQGNSVLRWLMVAAIVFFAVPLLQGIIAALIGRLTKTKGDTNPAPGGSAAGIASLVRPINLLIFVGALWMIESSVLVLPDWFRAWSHRSLYFAIMLGSGWFVARLADVLAGAVLTRFATSQGNQVDRLLLSLFRGGAQTLGWTVVLMVGLETPVTRLAHCWVAWAWEDWRLPWPRRTRYLIS